MLFKPAVPGRRQPVGRRGRALGGSTFSGVSDGLLLCSGRRRRSVCLEPADGRAGPGSMGVR